MNIKTKTKRGFTLIELLVVIAIIAILMVAVVITLNPGQLLAQSRDSNRLSDIATLKTALTLYTADVATTTLLTGSSTKVVCFSYSVSSTCSTWFASSTSWGVANSSTPTVSRGVGGAGWIPVNFNAISSGAPFSQLPIDPVNATTGNLFYSYAASGTALFKLNVGMESTKFQSGGTADVCSTDGGISTTTYEAGTAMGANGI
jgi:prepilin-type N-terminal cleavage/methylation domain-containing protein